MLEPALLLSLALGVLWASFPFGFWVGRAFQLKDLRLSGSGELGAISVGNAIGFYPAGLISAALGFSKGVVSVLLLSGGVIEAVCNLLSIPHPTAPIDPSFAWLGGFLAVFFHCFSPWMKFKGGSGISACFGALSLLAPLSAVVGLLCAGLTYLNLGTNRKMLLKSVMIGLFFSFVAYGVWTKPPYGESLVLFAGMVFVSFVKNRSEIDALIKA